MTKACKGFTMMELVTSVALIAVLLTIALPSIRGLGMTSREEALRGHLATVRAAASSFSLDLGCHPAALTDLTVAVPPSECIDRSGNEVVLDPARFRGPYLPFLESDPVSDDSFNYSPSTTQGRITSSASGTDSRGVAYSTY